MNHYRKKVLNLILYFSENTKHLNSEKLSKLLYLFDAEHVRQRQALSIYLKKYALDWKNILKGDEFSPYIEIRNNTFINKSPANMNVFTPRDKKLLKEIILTYKNKKAEEMPKIKPHKIREDFKEEIEDSFYLIYDIFDTPPIRL